MTSTGMSGDHSQPPGNVGISWRGTSSRCVWPPECTSWRRAESAELCLGTRGHAGEEIGAAGKDFLEFDIEAAFSSRGGEEIADALLAGVGVIGWGECGIDAGKRDQFGQKRGGVRHAGRGYRLPPPPPRNFIYFA